MAEGTDGGYDIPGTAKDDTASGGAGNEKIRGDTGNDTLSDDGGNDGPWRRWR